jgi:hypothetical protein
MLEAVVLPVVADLQHEECQAHAGTVTRLAFRMRNYLGLVNAMCLHFLVGRMGPITISKFTNSLRWLVMVPLAPLAAFAAQVLVIRLAWFALGGLSRDPGWTDWTVWAAKCATCPFMGAAFVAVVWLIAPTRKAAASNMALAVVVGWGGLLMVGAFQHIIEGMFHWWGFVMGLSGVLGGVVTWWLVRRSVQRRVVAV